jgi:DNA-binding CsgD family transcriptional regulator
MAHRLGADRLVLHAGETVAQLPPGSGDDPPSLAALFELAMSLGDGRVASRLLLSMATEELLSGSIEGAAFFYRRGLTMTREIGYWHGSGQGVMGCAALAGISGQGVQGARLHGSVMAHVPVLRRGIPPAYFALYDQMIVQLRAALSPTEFDRHISMGTRLSWDDAISEALDFVGQFGPPGSTTEQTPVSPRSWRPSSSEGHMTAKKTESTLTGREIEVLRLIAAGESNKDIARLIGVSPKTVMHHSVSIYRKLAVRGRAEATATAYQTGLMSSQSPPRSQGG